MCSILVISVTPSEIKPAITIAAPALKSVALTTAPVSLSTPSIIADLPSTFIVAPIFLSSSTCLCLFSHIVSTIILLPLAVDSRVHIGC